MNNEYKKESCYILQDDQLFPLFTVQEVMHIAADLKLGNNLSEIAKLMVVSIIFLLNSYQYYHSLLLFVLFHRKHVVSVNEQLLCEHKTWCVKTQRVG